MATRRTVLLGITGGLAATAGCLDTGAPVGNDGSHDEAESGSSDEPESESSDEPESTSAERGYFLTVAPVEANDGLEAVLSTDDEEVAEAAFLAEAIDEMIETFEVTRTPISAAEAEEFEAITADVEPHFGGNPPGYYIEHEGRRVSVTLGGG